MKKNNRKKGIIIIDENSYTKKIKGLKRYCTKSYKHLIFNILPKLLLCNKKDGKYSVELPIEDLFISCYGKIELHFSIKNDVVLIEDILPNDILLNCYMYDLPTYHGIPYYDNKGLIKLKIMEKKNEKENKKNIK